jgi:hypothetical protein
MAVLAQIVCVRLVDGGNAYGQGFPRLGTGPMTVNRAGHVIRGIVRSVEGMTFPSHQRINNDRAKQPRQQEMKLDIQASTMHSASNNFSIDLVSHNVMPSYDELLQ